MAFSIRRRNQVGCTDDCPKVLILGLESIRGIVAPIACASIQFMNEVLNPT